MAEPRELLDYKNFLVAYGGGYLRNTRWDSDLTCNYCTGIPGNPEFPTCYQCGRAYANNPDTSDLRGFVSYGWDRSQSATVMYGYKDAAVGNRQAQRLVNVMLFYALHEHLGCATDEQHGSPVMWAAVPSLRQRGHPQVLHTMTAGLLRNMPEAQMTPSNDVRSPRSFRPENFAVASPVTNQHVLLIDDTWTSGGHAESAAAALKRAGAARVTLLVLARWLDLGRGRTEEFIRTELRRDFDPDICPFGR
jgi:hypothetical protein